MRRSVLCGLLFGPGHLNAAVVLRAAAAAAAARRPVSLAAVCVIFVV